MRTVKAGETFEVQLPGNPTTGYRWQWVPVQPSAKIGLLSAGYQVGNFVHQGDGRQGPIGGGGAHVFGFQAREAGDVTLVFEYRRTFETLDRSPARTHVESIRIQPVIAEQQLA